MGAYGGTTVQPLTSKLHIHYKHIALNSGGNQRILGSHPPMRVDVAHTPVLSLLAPVVTPDLVEENSGGTPWHRFSKLPKRNFLTFFSATDLRFVFAWEFLPWV